MKYKHIFNNASDSINPRYYKENDTNIRIDFFENVLRIAIYKDNTRLFPTYSICPGDSIMPRHGRDRLSIDGFTTTNVEITKTANGEILETPYVKLDIDYNNFHIKYIKDNNVLFEDRDYYAYNFEGEEGSGSTHFISRERDEHIYGLGDKTGDVNKNKRHFKLETLDAMGYDSNSSDPLYKQIPFYICKNSKGSYGIYYDTYANGEMDFGHEINNYYTAFKSFKSEDEALVFYVIFGSVPEILTRFSYMCGKNMLAPKWSLKYGGSTMSYTDSPNADKELHGFLDRVKEYNIDCGQFYLSSGYTQKGERRYVFNWNRDKIPDPIKLAKDFKKQGIHFIPNIKPAFLTDHFMYDAIAAKGWFLHYADGTPAIFPFWSGMGSYLDFTNDEAFEFWTKCVKEKLVDYGYDSIWNDNNEYDIKDPTVLADGFGNPISAKLIRPLFSYLMSMASHEAQSDKTRFMNVTRSGIAGLQRIAQTWTGDNNTAFDELRGNHKMAMTMSLSGLYFFGADIGGFAGPRPERELFIRWIQYGLFQPRFVLHSWNSDGSSTMPWLYEDLKPTVKKLFSLRKKLLPYLYSTMYFCVEEYKPMIYPLFLKYPEYDEESDSFFLGDSILVNPCFDEGAKYVTVDLPENNGGWYLRGNKYITGKNKVSASLTDVTPYFIKGGSIIPYGDKKIKFSLYPMDNGEFTYSFFNDDGISKIKNPDITTIKVICNNDCVIVTSNKKIDITMIDHLNRNLIIE